MTINERIRDAISLFPRMFGLRGFVGDAFRISPTTSYINDNNGVTLYTQRQQLDGTWLDFAKGSIEELLRETVVIAHRWALRLADGAIVIGPIHGDGGMLEGNARDRLESAIRRTEAGRWTGLYEPKPGHARMYTKYTADGGTFVDVDLRGAVIL